METRRGYTGIPVFGPISKPPPHLWTRPSSEHEIDDCHFSLTGRRSTDSLTFIRVSMIWSKIQMLRLIAMRQVLLPTMCRIRCLKCTYMTTYYDGSKYEDMTFERSKISDPCPGQQCEVVGGWPIKRTDPSAKQTATQIFYPCCERRSDELSFGAKAHMTGD